MNRTVVRISNQDGSRSTLMKTTTLVTTVFCLLVVCGLATSCKSNEQAKQQPGVKVKVGTALKAKAKSPAPPPTAKQKNQQSTIGNGQLAVNTSQPSSYWTEDLDVDDDGVVETSDYLYDAQKGVLYAYREGSYACDNGGTANGGIMEALYADGNKAGQPVGSGWYAVGVNGTQCGATKAGLYGCRFDAAGNPTTCGAETINPSTGEIDVAKVQ
jgi:hypothetical protein